MQKRLPTAKFDVVAGAQCGSLQNGTLVLPVIVASRIGSDLEAAVNSSQVPGTIISQVDPE